MCVCVCGVCVMYAVRLKECNGPAPVSFESNMSSRLGVFMRECACVNVCVFYLFSQVQLFCMFDVIISAVCVRVRKSVRNRDSSSGTITTFVCVEWWEV